MAETKQYKVQNLGTPSDFNFPRIVIKGEVISVGRKSISVSNDDVIELEPIFAEGLIKKGYLLEVKEKKEKVVK